MDKQTYNQQEFLDNYTQQDSRLQKPHVKTEIIANNLGLNFERSAKIGKGVREIHEVNIFEDVVPIRLLSMREEREVKHATFIEMQKFPNFKSGTTLYDQEFNKIIFRKMISLATTPCPEYTKDDQRYLREIDLDEIPPATFAELINAYKALELEYNPTINQIDEENIRFLVGEMLDPEKKLAIIAGLTLSQLRATQNVLLEMIMSLEDNTSITQSLEVTLPTETNEPQ